MNGFDLSTISSIYVGSTQYSLIYIGSDKIWPALTSVQYDCEIEYLEGTGNLYIDLNIIPNENTGIYILTVDNYQSGSYDHYACGLRDNSGDTRWCVGHSQLRWYWGYGSYLEIVNNPYDGDVAEVTLNYLNSKTSTCIVSGLTYTKNLPSLSFIPQNNIRIFGSSGISADYTSWNGKLYAFKVSLGSTVVMDLIPVRVGQVGYMYDKIGGLLYGNDGTGSFILGPDIIKVKYLETTGTQYIDTGVIYNGNYRTEIKFLCNSLSSPEDNASATIFGARQDPNTNSFQLSTYSNGCFAYNGLYTYVGISTNTEYVAEFRRDNKLYINGVENKSVNNLSFNTPSSILLFALHQNSDITEKFIGKIYYFKMYDGNDDTILDLIPVRVGQTGYMYDKVSGRLLGNSGTGSFILGRDELPTGYTELEYISSSSGGNQYIDLGIKLYETLNTDYDIAMKFNIASGNANLAAIFACQDSDNDPWPGTFVRVNSSSGKAIGRYIGGTAKDNTLGNLGADIELPVQTSPNKNVTSLNNNNTTHQYGTSLFCAFVGGTNTPARYCNAKLYYFKLFVGGTLVRDLIPCKDSNNVVGMYDVVNNVFYTSPNGNAFVAGPAV